MPHVDSTTHLDAAPDAVWAAVMRPALLMHVAAPRARFVPVDPPVLPERWAPGAYVVDVYLAGVLYAGRQTIGLSFDAAGPVRRLRDDGYGTLTGRWTHVIEVAPDPAGGTLYRDTVTINAGPLTWAVALFARRFFAHRQRRLRAAAGRGFADL